MRVPTCLQLSNKLNMPSALPGENPVPELTQALSSRPAGGWAPPSARLLHHYLQVLLLELSGPALVGADTPVAPLGGSSGGHPCRNLTLRLGRSWWRKCQPLQGPRPLLSLGLVGGVSNNLLCHSAILSGDVDGVVVGGVCDSGEQLCRVPDCHMGRLKQARHGGRRLVTCRRLLG